MFNKGGASGACCVSIEFERVLWVTSDGAAADDITAVALRLVVDRVNAFGCNVFVLGGQHAAHSYAVICMKKRHACEKLLLGSRLYALECLDIVLFGAAFGNVIAVRYVQDKHFLIFCCKTVDKNKLLWYII